MMVPGRLATENICEVWKTLGEGDHLPPGQNCDRRNHASLELLIVRRLQVFALLLIVGITILIGSAIDLAIPPLPSSLYGTVKFNNGNVPDGTLVQALIGERVVAFCQTQTYQGDSVFALDVPGDDQTTSAVEGGVEADSVSFKVGGILANQSAVWHSATNVKLDLTVISTSTLVPPQVPSTPLPTQTPIKVAPTRIRLTQTPIPLSLPSATNELETQVEENTSQPALVTETSLSLSPTFTGVVPVSSLAVATSISSDALISTATHSSNLLEAVSTESGSSNLPKTNVAQFIAIPAVVLFVCLIALWYFKMKR
jgi:hypothetical protein